MPPKHGDLIKEPWLAVRFAPLLISTVVMVVFVISPYTVATRQVVWWAEYPLAAVGIAGWLGFAAVLLSI